VLTVRTEQCYPHNSACVLQGDHSEGLEGARTIIGLMCHREYTFRALVNTRDEARTWLVFFSGTTDGLTLEFGALK
jgi:hypothetical protein